MKMIATLPLFLIVPACGAESGGSNSAPVTLPVSPSPTPTPTPTPTPKPTPTPAPTYPDFIGMISNYSGTSPYVELSLEGYTSDERREQRLAKIENRYIDQIIYTGNPSKSLKYYADLTTEVNFTESGIFRQTPDFIHFQESGIGQNETFFIGHPANTPNTYYIVTVYRKNVYLGIPNKYKEFNRIHLFGRRTEPSDFPNTSSIQKTYTCSISTAFISNNERGYTGNSTMIQVDFTTNKISLSFSIRDYGETNGPSTAVNFTGVIDPVSHIASGQLSSPDGSFRGRFIGDFFGPQAKQLAAVFTVKVPAGDTIGSMDCR